jgi:hypothetical protein
MIQRSVGNSLAAIAGFWFVGSLHLRLTARGPSTAAWAAFGGGVAMVTLLLAGSAIRSAAVVGSLAGDPQVAKTLRVLEEGFSVWFGAPLIVFMLGADAHGHDDHSSRASIATRSGDPTGGLPTPTYRHLCATRSAQNEGPW